jgi:hypothetical protein
MSLHYYFAWKHDPSKPAASDVWRRERGKFFICKTGIVGGKTGIMVSYLEHSF